MNTNFAFVIKVDLCIYYLQHYWLSSPEDFENRGFTLTGLWQSPAISDLCFRKIARVIIVTSSFLKLAPFFLSTRKREAGVFKFLRFEARFRKAPFSWRISVDGRPSRRNKTIFSNFSGVGDTALDLSELFYVVEKAHWSQRVFDLLANGMFSDKCWIAKRTTFLVCYSNWSTQRPSSLTCVYLWGNLPVRFATQGKTPRKFNLPLWRPLATSPGQCLRFNI